MPEEEKDKKINFRIFTAEDLLSNQSFKETKQITQKEDEINIETIDKVDVKSINQDLKNLPKKEESLNLKLDEKSLPEAGVINFSSDIASLSQEIPPQEFEKESGLISPYSLTSEIPSTTFSSEKESEIPSSGLLHQEQIEAPIFETSLNLDQKEESFQEEYNKQYSPEVFLETGKEQGKQATEREIGYQKEEKEIPSSFKPLIEPSFALNQEINKETSTSSKKITFDFSILKKFLLPIGLSLIVLFIVIFKPYQKINLSFSLFKGEKSKVNESSEFEKPVLSSLAQKIKNQTTSQPTTLTTSTFSTSVNISEKQDQEKSEATDSLNMISLNKTVTSSLVSTNISTLATFSKESFSQESISKESILSKTSTSSNISTSSNASISSNTSTSSNISTMPKTSTSSKISTSTDLKSKTPTSSEDKKDIASLKSTNTLSTSSKIQTTVSTKTQDSTSTKIESTTSILASNNKNTTSSLTNVLLSSNNFWQSPEDVFLNNYFQLEVINLLSLDLNSLNKELSNFFRKQLDVNSLLELGIFYQNKKVNLSLVFDYFIKPTKISNTEINNFKKSLTGNYAFFVYYGYVRKYPILVLEIKDKEKVVKFNNLWEKNSMASDLKTLFLDKNSELLYPNKKNFESKKINGLSYRILDFGNNYKIIWTTIDDYLIYSTTENGLSIIFSVLKSR